MYVFSELSGSYSRCYEVLLSLHSFSRYQVPIAFLINPYTSNCILTLFTQLACKSGLKFKNLQLPEMKLRKKIIRDRQANPASARTPRRITRLKTCQSSRVRPIKTFPRQSGARHDAMQIFIGSSRDKTSLAILTRRKKAAGRGITRLHRADSRKYCLHLNRGGARKVSRLWPAGSRENEVAREYTPRREVKIKAKNGLLTQGDWPGAV